MNKSLNKPFSKELFDDNDLRAKEVIKKHLNAIDSDDIYGPDLFVPDGNYYAEVEVKHSWKTYKFQFDTVNIPKRKLKYLDYGMVVFYVLSKDLRRAIIVQGRSLKPEYLKEVKNKFISEGEFFFQIPLSCCIVVTL